jgi:hypothetical protein
LNLTQIGLEYHRETILRNSLRNAAHVKQTIRDFKAKGGRALIASAGPSFRIEQINNLPADVCLIVTDSLYLRCLRECVRPAFVVTLDPHPTRMARLFGAPPDDDDYFERTRPDQGFEGFSGKLEPAPLIIATTAPANVVEITAHWPRWWFVPLVDKPEKGSLTRIMCAATGAPALNTGGTVGTAAWVFAHQILRVEDIAAVGMDFGYKIGTPLENTQEWPMLRDTLAYSVESGHWGDAIASPTYTYYRDNFLSLLEGNAARVTNCTGGGLLCGDSVDCMELEQWLAS